MKLKGWLLLVILTCSAISVKAQTPSDPFRDNEGNSYHQLFLDFRATEILDIEYVNDGTPADGSISSDGYSIILKNYPGNLSVKASVRDESGRSREVTKSKCFIDPVLLEL